MKQTCPICKEIISIDENLYQDRENVNIECPVCGNTVVFTIHHEENPPKETTKENPNLTKCPECGNLVSKKADTCPHCGVTLIKSFSNNKSALKDISADNPKQQKPQSQKMQQSTNKRHGLWIGPSITSVVIITVILLIWYNSTSNNEGDDKDSGKSAINEIEMVFVEGGSFTMGCTSEQGGDCYNWEIPAHRVTIDDFSICKYEVTQVLWKEVMGSNPSVFKGNNHPVENVSWEDCQEFIRRLNDKTGKSYRLPTEAEWEYAARGGNKSCGYKYSGSNNSLSVTWCIDNSNGKTHPVGTKSPNELGIYDMSGNVWEWCSDWYGGYSNTSQSNPKGCDNGSSRIRRGGCWTSQSKNCRVSDRNSDSPEHYSNGIGLRLALSQPTKQTSKTVQAREMANKSNESNGHDYVDLGLPSGTKWATCNVGANRPENYGDYFSWGETKTKSIYSKSTYLYYEAPITLSNDNDVAHIKWGGTWRIPTKDDFDELKNNCNWEWTIQNGQNGYKATGPNGKSIFFPAAGNHMNDVSYYKDTYCLYWLSTSASEERAWYCELCPDHRVTYKGDRYLGLTIRPVCNTD